MATSIVGVDVGGTSIRAVRFDGDRPPDLTPAASVSLPTPRGAAAIAAAVSSAVLSTIDGTGGDPVAVALGMPGRVDVATGTVSSAVNLGIFEPAAIGDLVGGQTGLPVHVENDVNAAALGAHAHLGLGPDASLAYINIGTGIAAGFVLGGRLWRGATGSAGEVGHIPMRSHAASCACGQVGCLEAAASGRAVDADPDRRRDVAAVGGVGGTTVRDDARRRCRRPRRRDDRGGRVPRRRRRRAGGPGRDGADAGRPRPAGAAWRSSRPGCRSAASAPCSPAPSGWRAP